MAQGCSNSKHHSDAVHLLALVPCLTDTALPHDQPFHHAHLQQSVCTAAYRLSVYKCVVALHAFSTFNGLIARLQLVSLQFNHPFTVHFHPGMQILFKQPFYRESCFVTCFHPCLTCCFDAAVSSCGNGASGVCRLPETRTVSCPFTSCLRICRSLSRLSLPR